MANLTADDLIDLSRWHAIQFRDPQTAVEAVDRYERYLERTREVVRQPSGDINEWLEDLSDRAA